MRTYLNNHPSVRKYIFLGIAVLCLFPFISPPLALTLGVIVAQLIGNPYVQQSGKLTHILLKVSVVGLGFGMNVNKALETGKTGFLFTVISVVSVLLLGWLLGKLLKLDKVTAYLVSAGTAICGGSAIAAVGPIVKAKETQMSLALAAVFILNSVALIVFPFVGHLLELTQYQFGMWSAIAIHDTSSVVGAAGKYGDEALEIATTVKLARALWIIPLSFVSMFLFNNKEGKIKIPYFIGLFILAMCLNTYFPGIRILSPYIVELSKAALTFTLFLIGAGLSLSVLKKVGIRPFIFAVMLWVFISVSSLLVVIS